MQHSAGEPDSGDLGFGAWLGFWLPLAALAVLAVVGAAFASAGREPGDLACGLILAFASIALAFMRIKAHFDGDALDWGSFLLVDDMTNLVAVIVAFVILALGGLFAAAAIPEGGLHIAGIALFVTSGLGVFLSLKHVFDNIERRG